MSNEPTGVAGLGTILSIWAHPDDETYLCGGIMAAARDLDQRVVCVAATAGELGTGDPERWPPHRLGPVRRWEAAASMAVLGVGEHEVHTFPDGGLAERDREGIAWAERLLTSVAPDTILTFGPDGMTYHPDHIAVHRWVTEAWRRLGHPGRLLYATTTKTHIARFGELYEEWNMYMSDERPAGVHDDELAVYLRVDGPLLDRKLTALRAMASQTSGLLTTLDLDTYVELIADEWFVAAPAALSAGEDLRAVVGHEHGVLHVRGE